MRSLVLLAGMCVAPLLLLHCNGTDPTVSATPDDGGRGSVDGSNTDVGGPTGDAGADSQGLGDTGTVDAGPKQVFVTSKSFDGRFNPPGVDAGAGGATAADARCMEAAAVAFPGRTFHAWIAIGATAASARVGHGPWYAGTKLLGDLALLTSQSAPLTPFVTENGDAPDDLVWTGTDKTGAAPTAGDPASLTTCRDWTDSSSAQSGYDGITVGKDGYWTDSAPSASCDSHLHLYCFEE